MTGGEGGQRPTVRLPRIARVLLRFVVQPRDRDAVSNDLAELYQTRCRRDGKRRALGWLARQIGQYPHRLVGHRLRRMFHLRPETPAVANHRAGIGSAIGERWHDVRLSARGLWRAPVFALTIIVSVGLGIGGTTAVFSIVDAVLIRPLPYDGADRMVRIYTDMGEAEEWGFSMADYLALREQQTSFEGLGMFRRGTATFNGPEASERISVRTVTPGLLSLLGIPPLHGRAFVDGDAAARVVVLSHGFWARRFGADPEAIGTTVRLDGRDFTVIGVLSPRVGPLLDGVDALGAMSVAPPSRKGPFGMFVVARLKPAVDRAVAAQELRAINDRIFPLWQASWPNRQATWGMEDLKESVVGDVGTTLTVVLGVVAFVLLIASTNAANLLVARGLDRRSELAVRAVLGASRPRLLRHLGTESGVLAAGGAVLGAVIAVVGMRLLTTVGAEFIPRSEEIAFTPPVVWFLLGVTAASGLLFGLIPSLQVTRTGHGSAVASGGARTTASLGTRRLRRLFVALQFAVSVPLLVSAGLLITSLAKLQRVDPGFDPANVLTLRVSLSGAAYAEPEQRLAFWDELTTAVGALPGVRSVGIGAGRPPLDPGFGNNFVLEDRPVGPNDAQLSVPWMVVAPDYFAALGVPLLAGRMLEDRDASGPFTVMVDERWAERFFGSAAEAVGRRFRHGACTGDDCPWATVVGVVGTVRHTGLDNAGQGQIYVSLRRWTNSSMFVVVRTGIDPLNVLPAVRAVIRERDPSLPLSQVATVRELMRDSLTEPRYLSILVAVFAAVAVLLSVIGIYGVMTYFVHQHTKDIGIRIALGGTPSSVRRFVLTNAMRLVVVGLGIGTAGAALLTRFMSTLLYDVQSTDPATFFGSVAAMLALAAVVCYVPARRAAGTDPMRSLRTE